MYNKLPCLECPFIANGICTRETCIAWFEYMKREKKDREALKKYIERKSKKSRGDINGSEQ